MSANEQIAVERFGSGQALLLLHGGSGPELTWERQMELAERWSLIIPTRRDADAEDVARLLTKRTHLVGFSYGALGVTLAAEEDPKMVRSLTLVETPADFVREHAGDLDALATAGIPIMLISSGRDREIEVVSDEIAKQLRARREVLTDEEGNEDVLTRVRGFNEVLEDFLRGSAGTARFRTA
jgi:pimeloyl-ACP methyl ester carboxylesterase